MRRLISVLCAFWFCAFWLGCGTAAGTADVSDSSEPADASVESDAADTNASDSDDADRDGTAEDMRTDGAATDGDVDSPDTPADTGTTDVDGDPEQADADDVRDTSLSDADAPIDTGDADIGDTASDAREGDADVSSDPDTPGLDVAPDTDAEPDSAPDAVPDAVPDAEPSGPFVLYLAPDGADGRDGLSPETALLSLAGAHARLVEAAPARDVEIRVAAGTYFAQTVVWSYTMPDHEIAIVRADPDGDRPVFEGCRVSAVTDPATQCPGGTWFQLRHSAGEETNLRFHYLRVQRYGTAISLNGARNEEATSNGSNTIYGCFFDRIGNVFNPALGPSTAAVRLVNSDDNLIANNHFLDVVNTTSGGLIHAIYVAHMSDRNEILRNRFLRSTGDPIRVRDYSNDNTVNENRFIRVGVEAAYSHWYCDHDARDDCTKPEPECPSWGNQFRNNELDGTWTCDTLAAFRYYVGDSTTGCTPPDESSVRLRTSGNVRTATPCEGD